MTVTNQTSAVAFYNNRPKKRISAGLLIFNQKNQLLIVKPNYLDRWLFPGGGVEESESPLQAALRECKEEIGLGLTRVWPAYVNYMAAKPSGENDVIQFVFTTDLVDDDFLSRLTLPADEIDDAKFINIDELASHLSQARTKAIQAYLGRKNTTEMIYLENSALIDQSCSKIAVFKGWTAESSSVVAAADRPICGTNIDGSR